MSTAAHREEEMGLFDLPANGTDGSPALREVAAERLATHRRRASVERARQAQQAAIALRERTEARRGGSSRVRDAVQARFQQSQSYREYLASEAERAIAQAEAEAEVAQRNARAVAEAQMKLLAELDQWETQEPGPREVVKEEQRAEARGELAHALADIAMGARELIAEPIIVQAAPRISAQESASPAATEKPVNEVSAAGLTVRLFEQIGASRVKPADLRLGKHANASVAAESEISDLEEEIEFRRAPEFQEHVIETTAIPANLIEFPRQLIAPRKARPRLAEGPLREDAVPEPQLRIFEVEAEQISVEPAAAAAAMEPAAVAEWQTLMLDGNAARVPDAPAHAQAHFTMQPQTAPMELRLMAAAVDGACLLGALLLFGSIIVEICGPSLRELPRPMMVVSVAGVFAVLFLAFQLLFFTLAESTPGMRYARIALCTFADDNPSRKAMRRRIGAMLLAASPLALGLAWAFLDEERLGWHDRISRMYQRAY